MTADLSITENPKAPPPRQTFASVVRDDIALYFIGFLWGEDTESISFVNKNLSSLVRESTLLATEALVLVLRKTGRGEAFVTSKLHEFYRANKCSAQSIKRHSYSLTPWPTSWDDVACLTHRLGPDGICKLDERRMVFHGAQLGDNRALVANDHFPVCLPPDKNTANIESNTESALVLSPLPFAKVITESIARGPRVVMSRVAFFEVIIHPTLVPRNVISTQEHEAWLAQNRPCVAIGLGYPADNGLFLRGKMPGWSRASLGYHSDDGFCFNGRSDHGSAPGISHVHTSLSNFYLEIGNSSCFGPGDTVGCGIIYSDSGQDLFFFTKNDKIAHMGLLRRPTGDDDDFRYPQFPVVGTDCYSPVSLRFGHEGEPFVFPLLSFEQAFSSAFPQIAPPILDSSSPSGKLRLPLIDDAYSRGRAEFIDYRTNTNEPDEPRLVAPVASSSPPSFVRALAGPMAGGAPAPVVPDVRSRKNKRVTQINTLVLEDIGLTPTMRLLARYADLHLANKDAFQLLGGAEYTDRVSLYLSDAFATSFRRYRSIVGEYISPAAWWYAHEEVLADGADDDDWEDDDEYYDDDGEEDGDGDDYDDDDDEEGLLDLEDALHFDMQLHLANNPDEGDDDVGGDEEWWEEDGGLGGGGGGGSGDEEDDWNSNDDDYSAEDGDWGSDADEEPGLLLDLVDVAAEIDGEIDAVGEEGDDGDEDGAAGGSTDVVG